MIARPAGRRWFNSVKPQAAEIELIDKHVDHPHRIVGIVMRERSLGNLIGTLLIASVVLMACSQPTVPEHTKIVRTEYAEAKPQARPASRLDKALPPIAVLKSALADDLTVDVKGVPVHLGISGRISRAFLHGDSGDGNDTFFVDNANASTEVVGVAEAVLRNTMLIGAKITLPLVFNSSTEVDFDDSNSFTLSLGDFGEKELDGYLTTVTYGKISLGYGNTASNNSSELDKSETRVISRSSIARMAGGLSFANGGPRIKDVFDNIDGLGDEFRIRYDSPSFHGVSAATSFTAEGGFDVAVRYNTDSFGYDLGLVGAVAHNEDGFMQFSSSASALWENGLTATVAFAAQDQDDRKPVFLYGKVGLLASPFAIGPTAVGVDLVLNRDVAADGDDAISLGVFGVQTIDREGILRNIDLYLGLRAHRLKRDRSDFDDILAAMTGIRLRF